MKKMTEKFEGFPIAYKPGNFWMYPNVMDKWWRDLTGSEHKVLDFILRRTVGFKKLKDKISLSQIEKGVGKLDNGTGLTRPPIIKAIKGLVEKGFIKKTRNKKINEYTLIVKDFNQTSKEPLPIASKDNLHTINTNTINTNTINNDFLYKKENKKPFYMGEEMRKKNGKWMVIPKDGGPWCEYADKEDKIEWRNK